jgi:hypothetical protein
VPIDVTDSEGHDAMFVIKTLRQNLRKLEVILQNHWHAFSSLLFCSTGA